MKESCTITQFSLCSLLKTLPSFMGSGGGNGSLTEEIEVRVWGFHSEWISREKLSREERTIEWGVPQRVFLMKDTVGSLQKCTNTKGDSKEPSRD